MVDAVGAASAASASRQDKPATSKEPPSGTSIQAAATDFETFLQLLTAQLRNQDPLKPMESTEFVAQLASFASVEQEIRVNDQLTSLREMLSGGESAGLAQWIGKEVKTEARARFDGGPVEISVDPYVGAERAVLVVTDAAGQEVGRLDADPELSTLTWSGELDDGSAEEGLYGFEVEYFDEESFLERRAGQTYALVKELRMGGDAPELLLGSGELVDADSVLAVRDPASTPES